VRCTQAGTVKTTDWKELGFPEIDREHRALARIVRELQVAVAGGGRSETSALLEQLDSYSRFHFATEENAMRATAFPGIDAHILQHRRFSARITLFRSQRSRRDTGPELLNFVRRWFRTHTMGADEQFALFLRERAHQ
jgi:hemerythrin-like metal-binding protein